MNVKGVVLLQLFYKRKLRNGTKTYLEPKFFSILVKIKKLGFSAPLRTINQNGSLRAVRKTAARNKLQKLATRKKFSQGVVHKRRPQSGGKGFVQCGHGVVIQIRTSAYFGTKNPDFSKFMVCRTSAGASAFAAEGEKVFNDFSHGKAHAVQYAITSVNNALMQSEIILIGITSSKLLFPVHFTNCFE